MRWLFYLLLSSLILSACSTQTATEITDAPTSRHEVRRAMWNSSSHRFIYCTDDGSDSQELKQLLQKIANAQPRGKRIEVIDCTDLTEEHLREGHLSLFGNTLPPGYPALAATADTGWIFDGNKSVGPNDVLLLPSYRNPWNDGRSSVGLYVSKDISRLVSVLADQFVNGDNGFFYSPWSFEIHQARGGKIYGNYKDSTWNFDPEAELHLSKPGDPILDDGRFKIFAMDGYTGMSDTLMVKRALAYAADETLAYSGGKARVDPRIYLYPSLERLAMRTRSMQPIQYDTKENALHLAPGFFQESTLIFDPGIWEPYVRAAFAETVGPERLALMTAYVQSRANKNLFQETIFKQLTDKASRYASTSRSSAKYRESEANTSRRIRRNRALARVQSLERTTYAAPLSTVSSDESELPPDALNGAKKRAEELTPLPRQLLPEKLAGMTFAHGGYRIHNGYGGSKVGPSLDSLGKLGVNALSIVPYTFQRNAAQTAPFHISRNEGGENDAATIYSIREAQRRGWYVLLKPQIWVGDGWPGSITVKDAEDAKVWFANYAYWIMHYALLAEQEKVDGLVIGTELVRMTLDYPDEWRAIITDLRKVYSGHLTYAANWGEEFENLTFWKDLDVIGLNSYYPLSDNPSATDAELLAGAHNWMKMADDLVATTGKPLWLTETGYRSVERAWVNPHAETGDRAASPEDQRRCYRALLSAAGASGKLRGVFIWKWPSYLGYEGGRGPAATGFTPGGKPAADVLKNFYHEWLGKD